MFYLQIDRNNAVQSCKYFSSLECNLKKIRTSTLFKCFEFYFNLQSIFLTNYSIGHAKFIKDTPMQFDM